MNPKESTDTQRQNNTKSKSRAEAGVDMPKQLKATPAIKTSKRVRVNKPVKQKNVTKEKVQSKPLSSALAETNTTQQQSSGRGLSWIALIMSFFALVAGSYATYQATLNQQVTGMQKSGLDERIKLVVADQQGLKSSFSGLQEKTEQFGQQVGVQMNGLDSDLKSVRSDVEVLQISAAKSIEDVKADLGQSVARWRLGELRSLLRHVDQYYQFTGDIVQTKTGLELAKSNLAAMQSSHIDAVKTALAEDIIKFDANEGLDVAALNDRLIGMSTLIPDLTLAEDKRTPASDANKGKTNPEPEKQSGGVYAVGKALFGDISRLVKHKNLDATAAPSLDDSARFVLYESLQLNLQAAMVALMRRDNSVYQSQLQLADITLTEFFDLDQAIAKSFLVELDAIRAQNISQNVEPVSRGALLALDRVLLEENR